MRAFLMVMLVATPSLMLHDVGPDATQVVVLVAFFAAALTFFEYSATYPGLVEFRDAPPFNRIRFVSLFATVFLMTVVVRGDSGQSTATHLVEAIGTLIGQSIDFPYSPVRLVVLMLPESSSVQDIIMLRTAAGMAYLISLLSLAVFLIIMRASNWPNGGTKFNVWVNLPMFDPTTGGDVVTRLEREARVNLALGFLLPFLTPVIVNAASGAFGSFSMANQHTLIWTLSAWAFLPASLFMRGIAMQRVAGMIAEQRLKQGGGKVEQALQPA
ncbi:membrane protein [Sinisalibacter lacisalsi]|uniref:Membrane protein n=1 Tax=Sinisalibacter lacisalsi TaxID=1526570 RepID=A0ABQ1QDM0_9RHOB|nr:membrane protein [Sinisalibacter lacisalsi]